MEAIAFSPDGKTLVSGAGDHSVRLWDLTKQPGAVTLDGHQDWAWDLAFSPNGRTVASASKDATVKIWDVVTGRELMTLLHPLWVNGVTYSPDGTLIATACDDTLVRLWNPLTGEIVSNLGSHDSVAECVAFSPSGKLLASGSKHGEIKLWETQTRTNTATFHVADDNIIWSIVFTPDGRYLAAAEGGMIDRSITTGHLVSVWEVSSGKLVTTLRSHTLDVRTLAYSPDGKILATGSWDGTIKFWDTTSYREIVTLKTGRVQSLAFSADGKRLASAGADQTIKLWDVRTRQELCTLKEPGEINALAFSPQGDVLGVVGNNHKVRLWFAAGKDEAKSSN